MYCSPTSRENCHGARNHAPQRKNRPFRLPHKRLQVLRSKKSLSATSTNVKELAVIAVVVVTMLVIFGIARTNAHQAAVVVAEANFVEVVVAEEAEESGVEARIV